MGGYVHKPVRWNREAATLWTAGQREAAVKLCLAALDADSDPDADAFIQPGFYLFQLDRFDVATAVLERGVAKFPAHPMILLSLGSSYSRWRKHKRAIPLLERFLALGIVDASAYDALAMSCSATGDTIRARLFGTLALNEKDALTRDRHGSPSLNLRRKPGNKRKVIAFSLFGSHPRYLRGALHNASWRAPFTPAGPAASLSMTASMRPSAQCWPRKAPRSSATPAATPTCGIA